MWRHLRGIAMHLQNQMMFARCTKQNKLRQEAQQGSQFWEAARLIGCYMSYVYVYTYICICIYIYIYICIHVGFPLCIVITAGVGKASCTRVLLSAQTGHSLNPNSPISSWLTFVEFSACCSQAAALRSILILPYLLSACSGCSGHDSFARFLAVAACSRGGGNYTWICLNKHPVGDCVTAPRGCQHLTSASTLLTVIGTNLDGDCLVAEITEEQGFQQQASCTVEELEPSSQECLDREYIAKQDEYGMVLSVCLLVQFLLLTGGCFLTGNKKFLGVTFWWNDFWAGLVANLSVLIGFTTGLGWMKAQLLGIVVGLLLESAAKLHWLQHA